MFLNLRLGFQISIIFQLFHIMTMCPKILKTHLPNFRASYATVCALWTFFMFTMDSRRMTRNQLFLYLDRQFVIKYRSKYYVKSTHIYTS